MVIEPGEDDPLLRAIAEFRVEVDRLIDAEVRRREVVAQARDLASRLAPTGGPPREIPVLSVTPAPEPRAGAEDDPRRRLDLLAQRLESRLRQSASPGGRPAGTDRSENP